MQRVAVAGLAGLAAAGCTLFEHQLPAEPDAPAGDAPILFDEHRYVASELRVPSSSQEAMLMGLDIDGRPNDGIDNQLGTVLASLRSLAPVLDPNEAIRVDLDRGFLNVLFELAVSAEGPAFLTIGAGRDPQPPACAGPGDAICRRHLDGRGAFGIRDATGAEPMSGGVTRGAFRGQASQGPGMSLMLSFGASGAFVLPLHLAAAELDEVTPAGFRSGKLGGAIARRDIETRLYPALASSFGAHVAADCANAPPACGCRAGSTGLQLLGFFDDNDDCRIATSEVQRVMDGIVTSDLDLDGDGLNDAVSIGVGVQGVAATFSGIL